MDNFGPETLNATVAILLALAFDFNPTFRTWFEKMKPEEKRLVMLILLTTSTAIIFLLTCFTPWITVTCDENGFYQLIEMLVVAIIANQGIHSLVKSSRKPEVID